MSDVTPNAAPAAENAESAKAEAPKVETAGKLEGEIDFSSRFAALNRREKQIQAQMAEWKKKEEEYKSKLAPYEAYEKKRASAKTDVSIIDEILEKDLGVSFEDYLNAKVSQGEKKEPTADEKYESLQKKFDDFIKSQESQKQLEEQQQAERLVSQFRDSISDHIKQNAEKFELVNHFGLSEEVYKRINEHYEQHGELLEVDQACNMIEQEMEAVVEGATKLNKLKSKFTQALEAKVESTDSAKVAKPVEQDRSFPSSEQKVDNLPKTLTNSMQSKSPARMESLIHEGEELKKRSIEMLKRQGWK